MKEDRWMGERFWRLCGVVAVLAMTTQLGCGTFEFKGGGIRSVAAGSASYLAVYAGGGGEKLVFAIFTNVDSDGNTASAGSGWAGTVTRNEGKSIDYQGDADGIIIDGTTFKYAEGRVFLVAAEGDTITVTQLDLPVGENNYGKEFDRLADSDEVQEFLARAESVDDSAADAEGSRESAE